MKNMELVLDEKARRYAKIYSSLIKDEYQRKRANAAIAALCAYSSFLKKTTDFDIQDSMTIYRNPLLCSKFETADFYAEGYHIDVRVTFDENLILIPKIHYDNNIIPDFYAAVKIDKDINKAVLLGIADTSKTSPKPLNSLYYSIDASELISSRDFINRLRTPKTAEFSIAEHENFKENYLKFIDNEIKGQKRIEILKHLFECSECRTEFCCFTGFEMVNRNAAKYPDLINEKAFETIQEPEEYKDEPEVQNTAFESSNRKPQGFNASSAMTESDLKDETQMGYVPYTDFTPPEKEKYPEQNTEFQLIEDDDNSSGSVDIFREFAGIEENNEPEMETIQRHEVFESIPEGADIKPAEMQLISDDEIVSDSEDMALIDKDTSNDLIYEDNSFNEKTESEMLNIDDNLNYGNNSAEDGGLSIKEVDIRLNLDINDLREETDKILEDEPLQIKEDALGLNGADIMDQMFVDGALESELKEQEELSYTGLETPAYSGLNQPDNNAETIEKVLEDDSIEIAEPEDSSAGLEQSGVLQNREEKTENDENMIYQTEDDNINEIIQKAESEDFYGGEDIKEEPEDAAPEEMISEAPKISAEDENIKEDEIKEPKIEHRETPKIEEKQEEENDALFSMLPSEKETEKERTFAGNLDSELPEERGQNYPEYSEAEEDSIEEEYEDDDEDGEEEIEEYEEYDDEDDGNTPGISSRRTSEPSLKNMIITVGALAVLLAACGAGAFFYVKNRNTAAADAVSAKTSAPAAQKQNIKDMFNKPVNPAVKNNADKANPAAPVKKIALSTEIPKVQQDNAAGSEEQNINKAIAKALAEGPAAVTLKGVNWYAAPELVSDKAFKKYMQDIDNTLRLNLKNNLINVKEVPPQNQITAKFAVDNNRSLRKVLITESSGSDAADKVVLQSLNETFKGLKSPILTDSPLKADMYFFKVVINL